MKQRRADGNAYRGGRVKRAVRLFFSVFSSRRLLFTNHVEPHVVVRSSLHRSNIERLILFRAVSCRWLLLTPRVTVPRRLRLRCMRRVRQRLNKGALHCATRSTMATHYLDWRQHFHSDHI